MKKRTTALVAGVAFCGLIVPASAADVNSYENPFDGFYVGVHGGYGWADSEIDYTGAYENYSISNEIEQQGTFGTFGGNVSNDMDGALLGAQAGANFVMDNGLLLGAEVSGSWSGMSNDQRFGDGDIGGRFDQEVNAIGLAQLKLGWANDSFALYGMGGLALGRLETSGRLDAGMGVATRLDDEQTMTGWTIGAGAEYMVSSNVSIGVSYNYIDLGKYDQSYDFDQFNGLFGVRGRIDTDNSLDMHVVKASLNYHF